MKTLFSLILCLTAAGCATQTLQADGSASAIGRAETAGYAPATASALAFDPPVTIGVPVASLSREGRANEAFAGYEQQITTFSYTHQRDEIRVYGDYGTLERRAYTDRTSITTR